MNCHWSLNLAARVLINALVGGILVAIIGATCLGFCGWITGTLLDRAGLGNILNYYHYAADGADFGVTLGALSGITGAFIFGIAAFKPSPRFFSPIHALFGRVAVGQFLGALGAATFFALYEYLKAHLLGQRLARSVLEDIDYLLWGIPALMLCGAIAGALSKRERAQSATLKEHENFSHRTAHDRNSDRT